MNQYDDKNKGAIWKNDKRETDRHPHFTGTANIDGVEFYVSAWKRDAGASEKAPALRFAFTVKGRKDNAKPDNHARDTDDLNDDIPF